MGLDFVEFVMHLEDAFGIKLSDRDAADLLTVGQWHAYLMTRAPHMSADEVWQKELDALCEALDLTPAQRDVIEPGDNIVRDLGMA